MARITRRRKVTSYAAGAPARVREDVVAVEEPLQIRLRAYGAPNSDPAGRLDLSVTMRTPGDDFDLVAGFLVGEGLIRGVTDLATMRYCAGTDAAGEQTFNVVDATLGPGIPLPHRRAERRVMTTSACGICGTTSIEDVVKTAPAHAADLTALPVDVLLALPRRLREDQSLFTRTGGVHAAGLFTVTGQLLCLREDVGRHNAVDKVVGWGLRDGRLPLTGTVLQVSGRASFELVQKAHLAGVPVLSAVGAPSSLAVELADEVGLTVAGFNRGSTVTIYTHEGRITPAESANPGQQENP